MHREKYGRPNSQNRPNFERNNNSNFSQPQQAPVKVGEEYAVKIDSVGEKGDGIARVKGFVLFVAGVKKGDYVKIKISKVMMKAGFAEKIAVLEEPQGPYTTKLEEYKEPKKQVDTKEFEALDYSEEF